MHHNGVKIISNCQIWNKLYSLKVDPFRIQIVSTIFLWWLALGNKDLQAGHYWKYYISEDLWFAFPQVRLATKTWNTCVSQKDQKLKRKLNFDIPQFKFLNGLQQETFISLLLFWDKYVCGSLNPKKCSNILANSESCKQFGDFGIWVGWWSKWNGGVKIFSTHLSC